MNFYLSPTDRVKPYVGLYSALATSNGDQTVQFGFLGLGLLIGLHSNLALRLAAPLRLAIIGLGSANLLIFGWTPTLGLAFFL